jgi:diadenosine tetraphosphate (Ap4A) HIT family hydrolase
MDYTNNDNNYSKNYSSTNTNTLLVETKYHIPPPGVNYETNPTVFGRILDGTLPSCTLFENDNLLTIRDRTSKARLHGLVIPKRFIQSVKTLNVNADANANANANANVDDNYNGNNISSDLDMILEMKAVAIETLKKNEPDAYANEDYILCFHIPPFISVGHLHLHVLAPASEMNILYRWGKYLTGTFWCSDVDDVIHQLRDGKLI